MRMMKNKYNKGKKWGWKRMKMINILKDKGKNLGSKYKAIKGYERWWRMMIKDMNDKRRWKYKIDLIKKNNKEWG